MDKLDHRIKALLDSVPLACSCWDKNQNLIDCNQEVLTVFGVSSKEEFLHRFSELSPTYQPDGLLSVEKVQKMISLTLTEGKQVFGWMHQSLTGEQIPAEVTLVPLEHDDKIVVMSYMRDLRAIKASLEYAVRKGDHHTNIMLDSVPVACCYWNEDIEIIGCNKAAVDLFKLSSKEEYVRHFYELSPIYQPDGSLSVEKAQNMVRLALAEGKQVFEWLHQTLDGEEIPSEIVLIPLEFGGRFTIMGYTHDLRAIKESLKEQAYQANRYTEVKLDSVPLANFHWSSRATLLSCNQAVVDLFGLSDKSEYAHRFLELSPVYQPDGSLSSEKAHRMVMLALVEGKQVFEWMHHKLSGEQIPAEITLIPVEFNNETTVMGYIQDLRSIRASANALSRMEELAYMDSLTGLYNRRHCIDILMLLLKKEEKFCVSFIDMDHLKFVNDQQGHLEGDAYIIAVVAELKKRMRKTDVLCRIGGDEFVVILLDSFGPQAEGVMDEIRANIIALDKPYPTSISYGVFCASAEGVNIKLETPESILHQSDKIMYRFKRRSRDLSIEPKED